MTETPAPSHPATTPSEKREGAVRDDAWLLRLARRLVRDEEEARDLAQDTWLAALRNPSRPEEQRAWLTAIARRLAAKRRSMRTPRSLEELDGDVLAEAGPAQEAERADANRLLRTALGELPPGEREILLWRWHQGLSYSEIAGRLGMTRQSATYRVQRAVEALRVRVKQHAPGATSLGLAPLLLLDHPRARRIAPPAAAIAMAGALAALVAVTLLPTPTMTVVHASAPIRGVHLEAFWAPGSAEGGERPMVGRREAVVLEGDSLDQAIRPAAGVQTPSTGAVVHTPVQVKGRISMLGASGQWEAMLVPLLEGRTVDPDGGRLNLDEDGAYEVAGAGVGEYLLVIHSAEPGCNDSYLIALPPLHEDIGFDLEVTTGQLTILGAPPGTVWVVAEGHFGRFQSAVETVDGTAHFPSVPAGRLRVHADDWQHDIEDGALLADVEVESGTTRVVQLP